jgi:hypothetical protein
VTSSNTDRDRNDKEKIPPKRSRFDEGSRKKVYSIASAIMIKLSAESWEI